MWNINAPFKNGMEAAGQWMAKALGGNGKIFVDRGSPALAYRPTLSRASKKGLTQYGPDIEIVGEFDGQFAADPEQQGISACSPLTPTSTAS